MEAIESKSKRGGKVEKPSWLRRRLIWPLKAKLLRTLPFKVFLIGVGVSLYWMDVGLDVDSCIRWATMNGCFRSIGVTLHVQPTEKLVRPNYLGSKEFFDHSTPDRVYGQFKNSVFFPLLKYVVEHGNEGFSTDIRIHQNLFHSRMFRFFKDTMANVDPETVLKCRFNQTQVTDKSVLHYLCPGDAFAGHSVPDIRDVVKKLLKKNDPQFVTRGILHFFWMESGSETPPEVVRLMTRAALKLNAAEMNLLKNFNPSAASEVLAPCVTQTTHISCVDDSKDFCVGSTIYVGLCVLFAIFLPGIVRALGNMVFYKGRTFPMGFGIKITPDLHCKGRKVSVALRLLASLAYVVYMTLVGPLLIFHSIFVLSSTYHREVTTAEVVQDNQEAKKDGTFKSIQLQKSAEAFSESVVQFSIQLTFLSVFTWISQAETSLGAFLSVGGVGQGEFITEFYTITLLKATISMAAFANGVENLFLMDRHFQRRAIRTSFGKGLVERLFTVVLAFFMLLFPIIHIAVLYLLAGITVFSWSLTGETAQLHHYLFLLPFLPSILALFAQGSLFQHYVKPETAEDQWYAFLSLFVPVRIFLIKDKEKAFNYYMLSTAVTSFTIICGWVIFTLVLWNLPEEDDSGKGFFIFCLEVILPIALHFAILIVVLSLLLWHLIINPNLSTVHCYPDYQGFQERLASFPNYWKPGEENAFDSATAQDLANEGFFFSHPRLRGLQVTCFSCGTVLTATSGEQIQTENFVHLDSCCKSVPPDPPASGPLLATRDLPYAVTQLATLVSATVVFLLHHENNAQLFHTWGIVHNGINLSIVATMRNIGLQYSGILKGIVNYFVPIFAPTSNSKTGEMLSFHLVLSALTSLSICAVAVYFQYPKDEEGLGVSVAIAIGASFASLFFAASCWGSKR